MLETLEVDADDVKRELWFQQVGATSHTAAESEPCIPDASFQVLATSPDQPGLLTFPRPTAVLWRHLKAEVHANEPRTLKA